MDQYAQQQSQPVPVEILPCNKIDSVLDSGKNNDNSNDNCGRSAEHSDTQLGNNHCSPTGLSIPILKKAQMSFQAPPALSDKKSTEFQKIPRPWAPSFQETAPKELQVSSSIPDQAATSLNNDTTIRWYHEPMADGPYHNIDSVRKRLEVRSNGEHQETHPSQNSVVGENSVESRK